MHRLSFLILLAFSLLHFVNSSPKGQVLGVSSKNSETVVYNKDKTQIVTKTAFAQKETTETETIPFETKHKKDPELDYGEQKTTQQGKDGVKTYHYLITFWHDDVIDKVLQKTDTVPPVEEQIADGTKITWNTLATADVGRVKYWYKLKVWATKYDANCIGCTGRTFSGTAVVKGVCATDPKVIPLGTNFYVEGYGLCRAEDIGGAIKGNRVDLGYVDASKGAWRTGYTNVYLLTNAPTE
ncbi:MAG TPA: G5 domain-containing protein [Candidatus Saccharimonadales bacterium]|nr:G5 domain-containing protein [Candidatus Saccharimonadales bacterium]